MLRNDSQKKELIRYYCFHMETNSGVNLLMQMFNEGPGGQIANPLDSDGQPTFAPLERFF